MANGVNENALAQLRDIHLPEAIGWWPIAPGWIILGVLLIGTFLGIGFFFIRRYQQAEMRRQALCLLKILQTQGPIEANTAAKISELLKRVAMVYYGRTRVASLQGEAWIAFLNETSKGLDFQTVRQALIEQPYQAILLCDLAPLFSLTSAWINQRRGPCLS